MFFFDFSEYAKKSKKKLKEYKENRLQFLVEIQSFYWNLILSLSCSKDLIHILPEALFV